MHSIARRKARRCERRLSDQGQVGRGAMGRPAAGANGAWEVHDGQSVSMGEGHADVEIAAHVSDPDPSRSKPASRPTSRETKFLSHLSWPIRAKSATVQTKREARGRIAAFSFGRASSVDEAVSKSQAKEKITFAVNFFIPSGSFRDHLLGGVMPDYLRISR